MEEIIELYEPHTQKSYTVKVTPTEKQNIINGDYQLASSLLKKAQEKDNFLAAYELHVAGTSYAKESEIASPLSDGYEEPAGEEDVDKEEDEGGKTNLEWTRPLTRLLLELYRERTEQFRDPKIKKKSVWADIKNIFIEKGYRSITEDVLDRKMRNLKKRYRTVKDNNKRKTGRGRITWEYFETMETIFTHDKTINFGETLSSITSIPSPTTTVSPTMENITSTNLEEVAESVLSSSTTIPMCPPSAGTSSNRSTPTSAGTSSNTSTPTSAVSAGTSPNRSTPTRSSKAARSQELYALRKTALETEQKRVNELQLLRKSIEENNRIQEDRNNLLQQILNSNNK